MDNKEGKPVTTDRRSILQYTALIGGIGITSSGVAAKKNSNSGATLASDDENQLGSFEDGLDGWKTNGGNKLQQITDDDFPAGVVNGNHGLAVGVNGDSFPMIENKKQVKGAELAENPHLQAHILALAENTDSKLEFRFRLHHKASAKKKSRGKGKGKNKKKNSKNQGRSSNSNGVNVEESPLKEVPQLSPRKIQWDMTDLPDAVLKTAKRLEIVWYLEEHKPTGGHRGRAKGDFDYQGMVIFDDIRLADAPPLNETQRQQQKKQDLHREHGTIVDRVSEERTPTYERGMVVYADGTEIPYEFELFDDGTYHYTIDGETFEFGGGE